MGDSCTIFCANLSPHVTEELLYELFLQAGPLVAVRIPKDANGDQRAFGFVEYKHECSVDYAIQLFQDTYLFGKEIQLRHRKNKQDSSFGKANTQMKRQPSLPNMHHNTTGMVPTLFQPNMICASMAGPIHPFMLNQGLLTPSVYPLVCPPPFGVNTPFQDVRNMSFSDHTRVTRSNSERGYRYEYQAEDNRPRKTDLRSGSSRQDSIGERQHRRSHSDFNNRRRSRSRSRSRSRERSHRHDDRNSDRPRRYETDRDCRRYEGPRRYWDT